jgi:hypothetical protein
MDGALSDKFSNGRRMRLASHDYAVANFPEMIVQLRMGYLTIDTSNLPETKKIITLYNDQSRIWTILKEDFDICKQIAEKISIPLFPTDIYQDYLDRALAFVQVEFAQRP